MYKDHRQHKRDPHYKQAKKQGYRARSAYKLLDIQSKFNVFKRAFYILDLGSVPGSWLQVSKEKAEENLKKYKDTHYYRDHYKIMGADLKRVSPIEGINMVKMDITTPEFQREVESFFNERVDLILSDASIKKSGIKFSDSVNQIRLCFKILDLVKKTLKSKGSFVVKCFQGEDYDKFFRSMKKNFSIVVSYKPKSSRSTSNEIYLIGMNKK
jgi:23S rRNA (uridine2552-2'-O)-methyltransferase